MKKLMMIAMAIMMTAWIAIADDGAPEEPPPCPPEYEDGLKP